MDKLLLVANVSKDHVRKFHIPFIVQMKKLGWRVDVACKLDAPIPECDNAYDLPCNRNPFDGGIRKSVRLLQGILAKNQYDVIICNTITGSMVARFAAKPFRAEGLKVWYINHGMHFFEGASLQRWAMGYPLEKMLAPLTDVLVTINSSDYEMAKKHLNIKVIERIHGIGVNLQRFRDCEMAETEKIELRSSLGLSADDYVLTYVAEISENKNQRMLLEMFKSVSQSIPEARMLLIGPELDGGKIRELASDYGFADKVLFLGWREDVAQLLRISDAYTASSKSEGLGLNIIEAMACDVPVVAVKNRGHAEIIEHGVNGFLVEQDDHMRMSEYIIQLSGDRNLAARITKQAQIDIEKYETSHVLDELSTLFHRYVD